MWREREREREREGGRKGGRKGWREGWRKEETLSHSTRLSRRTVPVAAQGSSRKQVLRFETRNHILVETTTIYSDHYPHVRQQDLVSLKVLYVLVPLRYQPAQQSYDRKRLTWNWP
jgi:hypothetical protein